MTNGEITASRLKNESRREIRRSWKIVAPLVVVLLVLVAWQAGVTVGGVSPTVLPAPLQVFQSGVKASSPLWVNTLPTLLETILGLLISIVVAIIVSTLLSFLPWLRYATFPLLISAQSVPVIVLAPIFIIWFGFGIGPKLLLVTIVTMLPMTIALLEGFLSADREAITLMRSLGASRWQIFFRLRAPSALPFFFTGLRVVTSFAVVAAIFSEYVGAQTGLGIYMQVQKNLLRTDLVLAAVAVSIAIGLALFALTYVLEALAMPWERRRKAMDKQ